MMFEGLIPYLDQEPNPMAPKPMGPYEPMGPPKSLMGDPKQPFYKDKDKMAMMLAALSNGFGNMTLRGNRGLSQVNNAIMGRAMENQKNNKTIAMLEKTNPELAKLARQYPQYVGKIAELGIAQKLKSATGEESTADIRNFEYFSDLDPEQRSQFLGLKRGDQAITGTDGSVKIIKADGTTEWVITPEQAAAGTYSLKSATDVAASDSERIEKLSSTARNAANAIPLLEEELSLAMDPERAEGAFASVEKMYNALKAELSDEYDTDLSGATKDQLLQAGAARRVMNWFKDSGLGARGMDTPAEYNRLLEAFGGMKEMTPQAYSTLLKRLIREKQRAVEDYNDALNSGRYSEVYNSGFYEPRETPWLNAVPELPPGFQPDGS